MLLLEVFLILVLHPLMPLEFVDAVPIILPELYDMPLMVLQPQSVVNGPRSVLRVELKPPTGGISFLQGDVLLANRLVGV